MEPASDLHRTFISLHCLTFHRHFTIIYPQFSPYSFIYLQDLLIHLSTGRDWPIPLVSPCGPTVFGETS